MLEVYSMIDFVNELFTMKFRILFWVLLTALFTSCAPTRIVAPLEKGVTQIGATLGRPKVNDGSLPLVGIYVAKGLSDVKTFYAGAQLTSLYLGTIQLDGGIVKTVITPNGMIPGVSWSYGANSFVSSRDAAFRLYPESGVNAYWKIGPHILNVSANTWVDPTWFLSENNKGRILSPSFGVGYRFRYKWIELQAEYKLLNPTREMHIPQAFIPSTNGLGGKGWYWGAAMNF